MSDSYSGYTYRRYKKRLRLFPFVVAGIGILVIFLTMNLFVGCVNLGTKQGTGATVPAVTFYTTESEVLNSKSQALEKASTIKNAGGAGYLRTSGTGFAVIDDICVNQIEGSKKYTSTKKTIKLTNKDHQDMVGVLAGTFQSTFEVLCGYIHKFEAGELTQSEISDSARLAYNNLVDLTGEFERIQETAKSTDYHTLLTYLTRQLFGLNLIWLEGSSANFLHVLRNSACWVIFAYFDLANTL